MSTKIPFKVSARTARLIGRENIASSKGAIIELVKNSYDADSKWVTIIIDNAHSVYKTTISTLEYSFWIEQGIEKNILDNIYCQTENGYKERTDVDKKIRAEFISILKQFGSIYIIDNGEGMTKSIIENHWMTIGTNNKDSNYRTNNGRIKSGAKGIGRFALDKLGSECEMITFYNPVVHNNIDEDGNKLPHSGYRWVVNWNDFEKDTLTIDSIAAELDGIADEKYQDFLDRICHQLMLTSLSSDNIFPYGTILKISNLRDEWDDSSISDLYADLSVLVPPVAYGDFRINLFATNNLSKYGEVESNFCDDYDYKLEAVADEEQNVNITVTRKEYDADKIPDKFFNRKKIKEEKYQRDYFFCKPWSEKYTFSQLIPGYSEIEESK